MRSVKQRLSASHEGKDCDEDETSSLVFLMLL